MTKKSKFDKISLMKFKPVFFVALLFMLCLFPQSSFVFADTLPQSVKIISDTAKIYDTASTSGNVVKNAIFGEVFTVENESGNFYQISFDSQTGFVLKAYCQNTVNSPLAKKLDTNAVITKDVNVYYLVNNNLEEQTIVLEKNTRVKLLSGSGSEKEFSQITFEYNNETLTGFVETNAINADGIPTKTVIAILLIISCVALFLILFGIYQNAKKKNKK